MLKLSAFPGEKDTSQPDEGDNSPQPQLEGGGLCQIVASEKQEQGTGRKAGDGEEKLDFSSCGVIGSLSCL